MGAERKKTGGGAGSAVRGAAAALAVTGLLFLLPGLLALEGEADGSALFQGRENLTFYYDVPAEALREGFAGQGEASGEDH